MALPPDHHQALRLRTRGTFVVIVSGLAFVASLALVHWAELPTAVRTSGVAASHNDVLSTLTLVSHGVTLWHFPGHDAGVFTVIAAGTVALAAVGLLSDSVVTVLPAACGSFYLLGQVFPWDNGFHYGFYLAGFWLGVAAALAMAIGGVLAVVGAASFAGRRAVL